MEGTGKRILAVEDDHDILELYRYIFSEAGYEINTSSTGRDLIQLILAFRPALILLDVNLGELNGADLCRQIKGNPQTAGTIVVLVSANLQIFELLLRSGADGFIPKPFDLEDLLERTAGYLAA
jgi:DNA-binding response OmpR family regulator